MAALSSPADHLSRARIQRISATDPDAAFFFRAHRFAFVTPPVWSETRFGFVLSIPKREGFVNNFLMASEDSPEAVTVSSSIARFKIREVQDGDLLRVNTRIRASCAVRFSEPPASIEARNILCQAVKMFLNANPDEAMQPMDVAKPSEDEEWIVDRLGDFDSYIRDQRRSARLMGQLFNAAASALAAYSSREDDLSVHRVTAIIPNLDSYPLRLRFQLSDMNSEAGWTKHRHVGGWVPGTIHFLRLKTEAVEQDWAGRCLTITLQTFPWNGGSLIKAVSTQGTTILALDEYADLRVCRYIAEAIAFDESVPSTAADMHQLLKSLPVQLRTVLEQDALEICERFREGRLKLEDHIRNRSPDDHLTNLEREELLLAERDVSDLIDKVINIMCNFSAASHWSQEKSIVGKGWTTPLYTKQKFHDGIVDDARALPDVTLQSVECKDIDLSINVNVVLYHLVILIIPFYQETTFAVAFDRAT
ncbi:unnamed protein product [Heligmosomoides polygyrus]|uniref:RNB domain-containing protein n=1 Tax=Heligmosomoides polygyrus TaxID=6339 RepID=A0A183FJ58_HELPZ|nr:unnamed protein product [Heligmosomoides polygyrus]